MAISQNGWPVHESYGAPLVTNPIPGTGGVFFAGGLDPRADVVLRYVAARWHHEVEPILGPPTVTGQWGYNYRAIRGQTSGFSNHASGTAIDINAVRHPLGTRTLTGAQLATLRQIQADCEGVVRFGAFYSSRVDEMHAEIVRDIATTLLLTARITRGELPRVPPELLLPQPGPQPTPPPPPKPEPPKPPVREDYGMAHILFTAHPRGVGEADLDNRVWWGHSAASLRIRREVYEAAGTPLKTFPSPMKSAEQTRDYFGKQVKRPNA